MRSIAPNAPFEPVSIRGESVTIETRGKILVLPTGNPNILPNFNEYTLSRSDELPNVGTYTLTVAELQHLIKPWIALYDPEKTTVDFFLFTHKPKKLQYKISNVVINSAQFQTADGVNFVTADGNNFLVKVTDKYITQLILYPGNGMIYHGQITYADLKAIAYNHDFFDTNYFDSSYFSDSYFSEYELSNIPNIFDVLTNGSLAKFLQPHGMIE